MDYDKKIKALLSENEFLVMQLEDLNSMVAKKEAEINLLNDGLQTEGELRSKIEGNLYEIAQIQHNMNMANAKAAAIEKMNEDLENDLLYAMKARQQDKTTIKQLTSTQTNVDILNEELGEITALYKKVKALKSELAEMRSEADNIKLENNLLKDELEETKMLVKMLRLKKINTI